MSFPADLSRLFLVFFLGFTSCGDARKASEEPVSKPSILEYTVLRGQVNEADINTKTALIKLSFIDHMNAEIEVFACAVTCDSSHMFDVSEKIQLGAKNDSTVVFFSEEINLRLIASYTEIDMYPVPTTMHITVTDEPSVSLDAARKFLPE